MARLWRRKCEKLSNMREKHPKLSVCGPAPSRDFALNFTNPEFGRFSGLGRSRVHPYGKCEKLMAKWRDFGVQLAISDGCRASCLNTRRRKKVKKWFFMRSSTSGQLADTSLRSKTGPHRPQIFVQSRCIFGILLMNCADFFNFLLIFGRF